MRFEIVSAEQRSQEWRSARAGRATGSCASNVMAKIKTGEAAARRDYRMQLAIERITGQPIEDDGWKSKDMQRGIELESTALAMYEAYSGSIVRRTGFLKMTEVMAGCSLDGDVDDFKGIVESKCPKPAIHVEYIRTRSIPVAYRFQVIHNMWVSGAQFCDFVSYCALMPEGLQYLCIRFPRDEAAIAEYEKELTKFLSEVATEADELLKLKAAA